MDKSNRLLSEIVAFRTYAKYLPVQGRRESLYETINRNLSMHLDKFPKLSRDIIKAYQRVHDYKVFPSLRAFQFSGDAILKNNVRQFNCSAMHIDAVECFGETLFLLLSGTGVGFSVQRRHVNKLPPIQYPREEGTYVIHDSINGWAQAVDMLVTAYFHGRMRPIFDYSNIRPKNSYLVTTGAKAPGPDPLRQLLTLVEERLKEAIGRRLSPINVHDIICIIADGVLAGGIRRAALISLFDATDEVMLEAKSGNWWEKHPYRARANNTAMLNRNTITKEQFRYVYDKCINSKAGEPGFMLTGDFDLLTNPCCLGESRVILKAEEHYKEVRLDSLKQGDQIWSSQGWTKVNAVWSTGIKSVYEYVTAKGILKCTENHKILDKGSKVEIKDAVEIDSCLFPDYPEVLHGFGNRIQSRNYLGEFEVFDINVDNTSHTFWCEGLDVSNCGEIALQTNEFCNLTSINQTAITSKKDWLSSVYSATLLGTLQASYTDFPYLRRVWKDTTELEALLGLSCTGVADMHNMVTPEWLEEGAKLAVEVNQKYAAKIGINSARRIGCVKPEGSCSAVAGSSSGIHARHSDYYLRRVRMNADDSLAIYLSKVVPELVEDDKFSNSSKIIIVPQKSPEGAITRSVESARTLFERTLMYHRHWVKPSHIEGVNTHNVSVTISYSDDEVEELFDLMWEHRNEYTAVSLLPKDNHTYVQAPFEECSKETFERYNEIVQDIDLSQVREDNDNTNRSEIVACSGGLCEIL